MTENKHMQAAICTSYDELPKYSRETPWSLSLVVYLQTKPSIKYNVFSLPSGCAMLHYVLDTKLFLQTQPVPYTELTLSEL